VTHGVAVAKPDLQAVHESGFEIFHLAFSIDA
jgi:hypothetical protein